MNREIKFRHWCPVSKYMTPFDNIGLLPTDKSLKQALEPDDFGSTLMQYIGKKDKNGVDIYEGDIDKSGNVILWSNELALFCAHFYLSYGDRWSEASYPIDVDRTEIVGNVFENPDLMPGLATNPFNN